MASSIFGWDLLYRTVENDIKNNQDILLSLTHFVLISNGFKCIGLGESKVFDGNEPKSETLPKGWNEAYAIRYVYQGRLYNLKATNMDDDGLMINLLRVDERNVSLVQLNNNSVAERTGSLDQMIPNNDEIVKLIKTQLIDKAITSKKNRETSTQTQTETAQQQTREPPRSYPDPVFPDLIVPPRLPMRDPMGVGRNDLYPFGGIDPLREPGGFMMPPGGGGMLFEPQRPFPGGSNMGIPPGSLPPGARFDPFRAPDERNRPRFPNRPDNDEMPPPGYDDMFM